MYKNIIFDFGGVVGVILPDPDDLARDDRREQANRVQVVHRSGRGQRLARGRERMPGQLEDLTALDDAVAHLSTERVPRDPHAARLPSRRHTPARISP